MLLLFFAGIMVVPLLVAIFYEGEAAGRVITEPDWHREIFAFGVAIALTAAAGVALRLLGRGSRAREVGIRDGFVVVSLAWAILSLFGALPFFLSGFPAFESFTDAFFETISGLTTTGSSILSDIEALPNGLLFWRSLTHWLGGMGIVVLAVAIFPALGMGGYQLYRAEAAGPTMERLSPRITETAKLLWGVYLLLTVAETFLLWMPALWGAPKMSLFDALCHTFGTLATGGFSTRNASIASFDSVYVDVVIMIFMYLGGISFVLHYQLLRRNFGQIKKDKQAHFFTGMLLVSIILVTISVYGAEPRVPPGSSQQWTPESLETERAKVSTIPGALRYAAFQVTSIGSTCGFATADFDLWPNFCRFLLILLMFIGACAGSTSGSLKAMRIMLLLKMARREIEKMIRPRAILPVKLGGAVVEDSILNNIVSLFVLYLGIFAAATAVMCWFVPDIVSAFSSVAATMGGVGPGLALVGPMRNYREVGAAGKWVLCACMLLGRLEIYSILIIIFPRTWRR
ncbi:MAG: TrkH family potassium uptake protein [Planctomycetes bacterium]|nr:TrkH family potassium uptake protein [Planctomycetota bacterium]